MFLFKNIYVLNKQNSVYISIENMSNVDTAFSYQLTSYSIFFRFYWYALFINNLFMISEMFQ